MAGTMILSRMKSDFASLRLGAGARWPLVVSVVLGALLLVQAGRLVWVFAAPAEARPASAASSPTTVDVDAFQRIDAFFRSGTASTLTEAGSGDAAQLRLFGVRAGGPDGGSAIIGLPDGTQRSVLVGEEVLPGLVLQAVDAEGAALSRGGSISRLVFSDAPAPAAPPPQATAQVMAPAPAAAADPVVDPAALAAQAGLLPRLRGTRIDGFVVQTRGDGAAVRAAGLQSGDVILAVNGVELTGVQQVAQLRQQLADAASAEIRFERGGAERTVTVRTRP